jgi:hypothetical protein
MGGAGNLPPTEETKMKNPEDDLGVVTKTLNFLRIRKSAYNQVFGGHGASVTVLKDLASFCRAHETTFHADPRAHAVLEGRREVWLRIQQHLNLSDEELFRLFNRK